jgi:hypothetical protein
VLYPHVLTPTSGHQDKILSQGTKHVLDCLTVSYLYHQRYYWGIRALVLKQIKRLINPMNQV